MPPLPLPEASPQTSGRGRGGLLEVSLPPHGGLGGGLREGEWRFPGGLLGETSGRWRGDFREASFPRKSGGRPLADGGEVSQRLPFPLP